MNAPSTAPPRIAARRPSRHRRAGRRRGARARCRLRRRRAAGSSSKRPATSTGAASRFSQKGVNACVARGLSVVQGDADTDLADYPDDAFDYVILSPDHPGDAPARAHVLEQLLRIGRRRSSRSRISAIGGCAAGRCFTGRMPVTGNLPYSWYDTPNIHLCTIRDFVDLCDEVGAHIEKGGGAQCQRRAHRPQRAVVVLEPVRRAGGVSAQPVTTVRVGRRPEFRRHRRRHHDARVDAIVNAANSLSSAAAGSTAPSTAPPARSSSRNAADWRLPDRRSADHAGLSPQGAARCPYRRASVAGRRQR